MEIGLVPTESVINKLWCTKENNSTLVTFLIIKCFIYFFKIRPTQKPLATTDLTAEFGLIFLKLGRVTVPESV